jgi:hypothetical protein
MMINNQFEIEKFVLNMEDSIIYSIKIGKFFIRIIKLEDLIVLSERITFKTNYWTINDFKKYDPNLTEEFSSSEMIKFLNLLIKISDLDLYQ